MRFVLPVALTGLLLPFPLLAAGGHHAVDDAAITDPGQCTLELWAERANLDRRQLQHAGLGCNVLGAEFGLSADRQTDRASPSLHIHGAHLKWATELQPQVAIGVVAVFDWQDQTPKSQRIVLIPLTWTAREGLAVHLNLGRSAVRGAADHTLRGAALEWQVLPKLQTLVEYAHDGQRPLARLGLRHDVNDRLSLDLSFARASAAAALLREGWWTVGANWTFGR